jgi:hypothetical protein
VRVFKTREISSAFVKFCSRYQRTSEQTPSGNSVISVPGRLFFKQGKTTQNTHSSGISCGIVPGRANIQIMASESEICVIGRISASMYNCTYSTPLAPRHIQENLTFIHSLSASFYVIFPSAQELDQTPQPLSAHSHNAQ